MFILVQEQNNKKLSIGNYQALKEESRNKLEQKTRNKKWKWNYLYI